MYFCSMDDSTAHKTFSSYVTVHTLIFVSISLSLFFNSSLRRSSQLAISDGTCNPINLQMGSTVTRFGSFHLVNQ